MRTTRVTLGLVFGLALLACGPERQEFGGRTGGNVVLDPPDVHIEGDHLRLDDHIHFGHDSAEILDDSSELLDNVALLLSNHPEITALQLVGHTSSVGDDAHNMDLSTRRAAAVRAALEQRGVAQSITSRGAGETEPLCTTDDDPCHAQNRRVEFKITR